MADARTIPLTAYLHALESMQRDILVALKQTQEGTTEEARYAGMYASIVWAHTKAQEWAKVSESQAIRRASRPLEKRPKRMRLTPEEEREILRQRLTHHVETWDDETNAPLPLSPDDAETVAARLRATIHREEEPT